MHFQVHFATSDGKGIVESVLVGSGVAYKHIVPRLKSDWLFNTYALDEKVHGITTILFTKIVTAPFTGKLQGRYGENIPDLLSLSGFAVKEIVDFTTGNNPTRHCGTFLPGEKSIPTGPCSRQACLQV
ncbi:MAG: hypothetical protein P1P82_06270 [Bacteroidales bacterium]|nr:hypothetical protein [Bacteroidales bacterium]MDT8430449.1 hypothetical protein [Bacteroidales bacterium]